MRKAGRSWGRKGAFDLRAEQVSYFKCKEEKCPFFFFSYRELEEKIKTTNFQE